jgi:hypothetical protein
MVRRVGSGTRTSEVHPDEVENFRAGGFVLTSEKNWTDGVKKDDEALDETGDLIEAIGKMKKADLEAFVSEREIDIDLDDFSNMQERKAAVIAVLEAD